MQTIWKYARPLMTKPVLSAVMVALLVAGLSVTACTATVPRDGAAGPAGTTGPTGPVGATGHAGDPGPVGATGDRGAQGEVGPRGSAGYAGAPGIAGAQGHDGLAGAVGTAGAPGADGVAGAQGRDGNPGAAGPAGADADAAAAAFWPGVTFSVGTIADTYSTYGFDGNDWRVQVMIQTYVDGHRVEGQRAIAVMHYPAGDIRNDSADSTYVRFNVPRRVYDSAGATVPMEYWIEWGGVMRRATALVTPEPF